MPTFSTDKVAFIYTRLPSGDFPELAKEIAVAAAAYLRARHENVSCYMTLGGADLLIRLDLKSYRSINDIQLSLVKSRAQATSWLFAVPYIPYRGLLKPKPISKNCLHFVMQLRIRRSIYATLGVKAEKIILDNIWRLARQFDGSVSGA